VSFRDFEHAGWEKLPARYHDAVGATRGTRLLNAVTMNFRRHGRTEVDLPAGPPFFRFSEEAECRRALLAAGFTAPQFRKIPQTWRLESSQALWDFMLGSTVRTGALLRAQTPQALAAIRADVVAEAESELSVPAVLASASK
jgi:hypothetical protein